MLRPLRVEGTVKYGDNREVTVNIEGMRAWLGDKDTPDLQTLAKEVQAELVRRTPIQDQLSEKNLKILEDLRSGARPTDIARRHGVSRQWVYEIKGRYL